MRQGVLKVMQRSQGEGERQQEVISGTISHVQCCVPLIAAMANGGCARPLGHLVSVFPRASFTVQCCIDK